jgi:sodium-dependent dicarboxylate transporter 2/3/5
MRTIPLPINRHSRVRSLHLTGVEGAKKVFASFSEPIIYVFLGSFMLAEAMSYHGLDKRFAYWIMSLRPSATAPAAFWQRSV